MPEPDDRWWQPLEAVGACRGDRVEVFTSLVDAYENPGRHHHGFAHASSVVDRVLELHEPGDDWAVATIAAWYHDAVHDPTASHGANEGASAVLAQRHLASLGVTLTATGAVTRLICLTASHQVLPSDRTGALVCDADLSILGASEERYERYVADVRAEYAHLDDAAWTAGRRVVLRKLLDRPRLFSTDAGRSLWEASARANISRELSGLPS